MMQQLSGRGTILGSALALCLAVVLTASTSPADVKKGKERLAETKYLMKGVVQAHCAGIGAALKDKGPADDKAWDNLVCHASVLNEMGYTLMADGRCPDKTWADASKTLRECSAKVAAAAKDKNLADAQQAFKALTGACAACHKAHRMK